MEDLGTSPGHVNRLAFATNDSTQIAGFSQDGAGFYRACFTTAMVALGTLRLGCRQAYGINSSGQVVGRADTVNGFSNDSRAFLYSNGVMSDLNELLDASGAGWTLFNAQAINDNGWTVGSGVSPSGEVHAFLLTPSTAPVSAPTSPAPLVLAVGAVLAATGRSER